MESRFKSTSGKMALFAVMTALTVVANLIMVPMPQPLAEYDLSPVLIYTLGVLMEPLLAGSTVAAAMALGVGYKMMIYGFPPVFVLGAVLARGSEAVLISLLIRWRRGATAKPNMRWEVAVMCIGAVWETAIFFALDWLLFGLGMAMVTLATIVDLVFIPIAVGVIVAIRRSFRVNEFS